jgi:hypothetical protein
VSCCGRGAQIIAREGSECDRERPAPDESQSGTATIGLRAPAVPMRHNETEAPRGVGACANVGLAGDLLLVVERSARTRPVIR